MNIGIDYDILLREYQRNPDKHYSFFQLDALINTLINSFEGNFYLMSDQKEEWELQKSFMAPLMSYFSRLPAIETCDFVSDKVSECNKDNIDVFVTDDINLAFRLVQNEVLVILITKPWNEHCLQLGEDIYRVRSWQEIKEILTFLVK